MKPRAILFDLDETLAESKQPITAATANLLNSLLEIMPVAIVSGGKFEVLHENVASRISPSVRSSLYLAPTCGAGLYAWNEAYVPLYEELLLEEEVSCIMQAIEEAITETDCIDLSLPSHGERIEFRGSQVTLSALGQFAPIELKKAWDPEHTKRSSLREAVARRLPEFDVKTGGSTSIDVTRPGINKAYGVRKISEHLGIPIGEMLYIGDALFPGGNDAVVKETGIPTQQTSGPDETAEMIRALLRDHGILS